MRSIRSFCTLLKWNYSPKSYVCFWGLWGLLCVCVCCSVSLCVCVCVFLLCLCMCMCEWMFAPFVVKHIYTCVSFCEVIKVTLWGWGCWWVVICLNLLPAVLFWCIIFVWIFINHYCIENKIAVCIEIVENGLCFLILMIWMYCNTKVTLLVICVHFFFICSLVDCTYMI